VISNHPDHRVIVTTHWYLFRDGTRHANPEPTYMEGNDGEEMWQKLIRKHENIFMLVCGHIGGQARLTTDNEAGKPVHQVLTDFQYMDRGGKGYLRTLRFVPEQNKIDVLTYSPVLDHWHTDPQFSYTLGYTMTPLIGDKQE